MYDNITVNTQSSIRIEGSGKVLYFDPLDIDKESHDADIIFVTHEHYDHFSVKDIKKISTQGTIYVMPESMKNKSSELGVDDDYIEYVSPGDTLEVDGMPVEVVAAYNKLKPFHMKSHNWCGYVVELDGIKYYITGDTDDTKEAEEVKCDVALVPVGGTYTMNVKAAAELIEKMKPKAAIPTHYGTIVGDKKDGDRFAEALSGKGIEVIKKIK